MTRQIVSPSNGAPLEFVVEQDVKMQFDRFPVPNWVRIKSIGPFVKAQEIARMPVAHIAGLPAEILDALVHEMLKELYAKAGRPVPFVHEITIEWAKAAINE